MIWIYILFLLNKKKRIKLYIYIFNLIPGCVCVHIIPKDLNAYMCKKKCYFNRNLLTIKKMKSTGTIKKEEASFFHSKYKSKECPYETIYVLFRVIVIAFFFSLKNLSFCFFFEKLKFNLLPVHSVRSPVN